jgi:hypothetical protein
MTNVCQFHFLMFPVTIQGMSTAHKYSELSSLTFTDYWLADFIYQFFLELFGRYHPRLGYYHPRRQGEPVAGKPGLTRLDMSPHLKPGNNHRLRPENKPKLKHMVCNTLPSQWFLAPTKTQHVSTTAPHDANSVVPQVGLDGAALHK